MTEHTNAPARCVALVGPHLAGKTTLLESILSLAGKIPRKGAVAEGTTFSDATPESRAHQMSVELTAAQVEYLGDRWTFIDCPGSIEFGQDARQALLAVDAAIVVCEPTIDRAVVLAPLLEFLDERRIPHLLFVNKMEGAPIRVRELLGALQAVSKRPLVLREVPIRQGDEITGLVDVVSERAWKFSPGEGASLVQMPDSVKALEKEARQSLIERLTEFDDELLAKVLEDVEPSNEELWAQLTKDLKKDLIVPVFMGEAANDDGVLRLLKALRHEVPRPVDSVERLGLGGDGEALAHVFKTVHASHTGKLSLVRVWRGVVTDGMLLNGQKVSGVFQVHGGQYSKVPQASAGDVVALGKLEQARTGDVLTQTGSVPEAAAGLRIEPPTPVYVRAIYADKKQDEVKLHAAVQKLSDEDPSLKLDQSAETGEQLLCGQGDIHILVATEKLRSRFGVPVHVQPARVPYKETIRRGTSQHSRYKRQTGGHGQFADVHLEIKPQPRGAGFTFVEKIVGGVIPKNFFPAIEEGVEDALQKGPLGYPVVDLSVSLTNGTFHSVDSSDQAFRTCAGQAMREALPNCEPVLLEPIMTIEVSIPREFTPKAQRLVTGRRGQLLGFDAAPGKEGWDQLTAYVPQAELNDFIIELRSLTLGLGTFLAKFDHLSEVTGRAAEKILQKPAEAHA